MTYDVVWLSPWYPVEDAATRAGLESQLRLEVSRGHVLHGAKVELIARRSDTDDALFAFGDGRIAEVHMTWSKRPEQDTRWPVTAIFASIEEWVGESMVPLHRELEPDRRP